MSNLLRVRNVYSWLNYLEVKSNNNLIKYNCKVIYGVLFLFAPVCQALLVLATRLYIR